MLWISWDNVRTDTVKIGSLNIYRTKQKLLSETRWRNSALQKMSQVTFTPSRWEWTVQRQGMGVSLELIKWIFESQSSQYEARTIMVRVVRTTSRHGQLSSNLFSNPICFPCGPEMAYCREYPSDPRSRRWRCQHQGHHFFLWRKSLRCQLSVEHLFTYSIIAHFFW